MTLTAIVLTNERVKRLVRAAIASRPAEGTDLSLALRDLGIETAEVPDVRG